MKHETNTHVRPQTDDQNSRPVALFKQGEIIMESKLTRMNPIQRSQANPRSLRLAINAKCYECLGCLPSWRREVENCTSPKCPLFAQRPRREANK